MATFAETDEGFLASSAIRNDERTGANRLNRYAIAPFAVHRFHHRLCRKRDFHESDGTFRRSRRERNYDRYYVARCTLVGRSFTLVSLKKMRIIHTTQTI